MNGHAMRNGHQTIASPPIVKWTWSPSPRVSLTGNLGSILTGLLFPMKKSPLVQFLVIAAVSSSVRFLGRLFGLKVGVPPAVVVVLDVALAGCGGGGTACGGGLAKVL